MTTWRQDLAGSMEAAGDPGPVVAFEPDEAAFDAEIVEDDQRGPGIVAWTGTRVYFVEESRGDWFINSAPRHPRS